MHHSALQMRKAIDYPEWEYDEEPAHCLNAACLKRWVGTACLWLGVVVLTVVVGLAGSREVLSRTPLEVLRTE